MAERYHTVNGAWPPGPLPKMTALEAIRAAKRLYRLVVRRKWTGTWKAGRGNHRTYPRGRVFLVNPGQGWRRMVHDLSHCCHRELYPAHRPHHGTHAFIERTMIEHVVNSEWLDGKLRTKKAKAKIDIKERRYKQVLTLIERWKSRENQASRTLRRATSALKELAAKKAYYEKILSREPNRHSAVRLSETLMIGDTHRASANGGGSIPVQG